MSQKIKSLSRLKRIHLLNAVNMASLTVAQIATVPLFLHYLGIQGYEEWMFISAIGFSCLMFDFGLIAYNTNTMRIAYSRGDTAAAQDAIGHGVTFFLFFFGIFGIAAAVIFALFPSAHNLALALVILHVPCAQLRVWLSYIFTARISQIGEILFFITYTLFQTLAYIVVLVAGGDVAGLAAAQIISTMLFGIAPIVFALRRYAPDIHYIPMFVPREKGRDFIKGCAANFSYAAAGTATVHFPVIMLGLIPGLPAGSLAVFTTSRTLTGIVRQFCQQMARSNGIEISRHLAPEQHLRMCRLFLLGAASISVVAAIGMGALWPVADLVVKAWTGKPQLYDATVIGLFCVTAVISAPLQLPMMMPQFTNRAAMMAKPLFAQIVLLLAVGLPAGYLFGAAGMVAALAIAEISTLGFVSLRRIIPEAGVTAARFLLLTGAPALILFIFSATVSAASRRIFEADNLYGLIKVGILWAVVMLPVLGLYYRIATRMRDALPAHESNR